jgi:hypothetical protein
MPLTSRATAALAIVALRLSCTQPMPSPLTSQTPSGQPMHMPSKGTVVKKTARWRFPKRRMRSGLIQGINTANKAWMVSATLSEMTKLTRYQRHPLAMTPKSVNITATAAAKSTVQTTWSHYPTIFKAYDIRGIVGKNIDENFAEHLGRAFGSEAWLPARRPWRWGATGACRARPGGRPDPRPEEPPGWTWWTSAP